MAWIVCQSHGEHVAFSNLNFWAHTRPKWNVENFLPAKVKLSCTRNYDGKRALDCSFRSGVLTSGALDSTFFGISAIETLPAS